MNKTLQELKDLTEQNQDRSQYYGKDQRPNQIHKFVVKKQGEGASKVAEASQHVIKSLKDMGAKNLGIKKSPNSQEIVHYAQFRDKEHAQMAHKQMVSKGHKVEHVGEVDTVGD